MSRTNRPVVALAVLGTVLAVLVSGAQAAASDPIVGYWKGQPPVSGPNPVMQVTGPNGDGHYWGLTMGGISFGTCTHGSGEVIWDIATAGGGYSGTHWGYANTDTCAVNDRKLLPAVWVVDGDRLEERTGDTPGGTVGACGTAGTRCYTFVRGTSPNAPEKPPAGQEPTTPASPATPETPTVTPRPGKYRGRTSQNKAMSFTVSRRHRITAMSFQLRLRCPDGSRPSFTYGGRSAVPIVGGEFKRRWDQTDNLGHRFTFALAGAFPSAKRAIGALRLVVNISDHGGKCTTGTPTWTARHA